MGGLQKCSNSWMLLLVGINIASWLELVLSAESRYEACKPKNCGSGPNISYPFYIQEDEPGYCGHPGFEVRCKKGWPRYRSSDADYIIQNITYESRSFRVVNAELIDTTCPAPLRNYSFDRSSLDFSPCHANIYFFYNCSDSFSVNYTSSVPTCDSNMANGTFVALVPGDEDLNWTRTACQFFVAAPVQLNQEEINQTTRNVDYVKLLMDGFTLKWIGFGKNCGECRTSGGYCGFEEENGVCYCPDGTHSKYCNDGNDQRRLKLGLGLGFGVLILMTIFLLSLYVMWHCFRRRHDSSKYLSSRNYEDPSAKADLEGDDTYFGIPIFSHNELGEATDNFASEKELGDGGFGTVYYGKLQDGREVAVKRLYEHNYRRVEQFRNEIAILKRLRHKNLVSLYGCTSSHRRELLLVYEYISNGTVADHLHGDRAMSSPLTWPIRMRIAIETANALVYLHASDIIHRDVKTNNILLDSHFEVKVADFGLSRLFPNDATHVSTVPQGSPGYVDPEYQKFYQLTDKSDVYSFGVVLIELISSMPAVDISRHQEEINLSYLAISKIQMRAFDELIDPYLGYKSDDRVKRTTISVAELAFRCLQQDKEMRPSMEKILEELKRIESRECGDNRMEVHDDSRVSKTVLPAPSPPSCDQTLLLKNPWVPPSPESLSDTQKTSSCSTSASLSS